MKKRYLFLIIFLLFINFGVIVSAINAAPSPTCKITGKIINSTFKPAYFQEDNGGPCNVGGRNIDASYLFTVKVNEIQTVAQDGISKCEDLYPVDSQIDLTLGEKNFIMDIGYSKGKIIEADIHMNGDECGAGIYILNHNFVEDRSCLKDDDCKIIDVNNLCCQHCGKADYSLDNFVSVNNQWYLENKDCNQILCPQCLEERNPDNEKWISKCIKSKCEKVNNQVGCQKGSIEEDGKCYKNLSNGRKAEIKIMPETASQKAIERLGQLGFNITLKEVGNNKVAYELIAEKEGKIFGLFRAKGKVTALVNAETGNIEKVKKPWWAFLASGI